MLARMSIALALAAIGVLTLAGCGASSMRPGATSIFEAFAPPSTLEAAQMALDKYDADNRYRGTLILANRPFAGEDVYMRLFLDNLDDADPGVRAASVRAIANHGEPSQAALLAERLGDNDEDVRIEAAKGLQRLHNPEVIDRLLESLSFRVATDRRTGETTRSGESSPLVRAEVADALAQYPLPRVVQALIAALDDPQLAVNLRALKSLKTLTGQDLGLSRRSWVQWLDDAEQPFAARSFYAYPVYQRRKVWFEYLPFIPGPPNEAVGSPNGMPREFGAPS